MGAVVDQLDGFAKTLLNADGLKKIRAKSWASFSKTGLPDRKFPSFGYLPLSALYKQNISLPKTPLLDFDRVMGEAFPECAQSFLVFIDGSFIPGLSNLEGLEGVEVLPLSRAEKSYGTFFANRTTRLLKSEADPFALLNGALHQDGAFLYVSPGADIARPIQLLHIVSDEGLFVAPRVHLYAGGHSKVEMVQTVLSEGPSWMNPFLDVAIEEGARVKLSSFMESSQTTLFSSVRATCKRDSHFKMIVADKGGKSHRYDLKVLLLEENSEVDLSGAFALDGGAAHANILIEHLAPHCRSSQLFKSLLGKASRSSFVGKIWVDKEAQKTDAFQLTRALILGDQAITYSEPNLEIFADDVKASHGSTTGQIDAEELFYLTSRGLATKEAKGLLVGGFIREVTQEVTPSCQERVERWVDNLT